MASNKDKLQKLCEIEGLSYEELIDKATYDAVVKGICMNPGCSYTTDVEPDQTEGYCEVCGSQTVTSCLVLAGII